MPSAISAGLVASARPHAGTLSHAGSLGELDLAGMRPLTGTGRDRIELDRAATRAMIDALRRASTDAVRRLVDRTRSQLSTMDPSVRAGHALHRLVTDNRFRRGPRTNLPVETVLALVRPYLRDGAPVPVMLQGFPFKQCDNGLKAAGPLPDLADLGAVLRLVELQQAFTALYPPGLDLTVMLDGGYHRPRSATDLRRYRAALQRLVGLLDAQAAPRWWDKNDLITRCLGPDRAAERAGRIEHYHRLMAAAIGPAAMRFDPRWAEDLLAALWPALPTGIPSFASLYRSLLYSVPVPAAAGGSGPEWSRQVLADPFTIDAGVPTPVRSARRAVLSRAWQDTIRYLAICAADRAGGVDQALPHHLRLRTGLTRYGEIGLTYLGGSALLPWHGTGCVDRRGRVAVDFLACLHDRAFIPVHCDLTGPDQPFLLVPPEFTTPTWTGRTLTADLFDQIRLRSR